MEQERINELQEEITSCFNCWLSFDSEQFEEVLEEFDVDISAEELDKLLDEIDGDVDDKASEVEVDIGSEIMYRILREYIEPKERKMYPEDDPNQLHLEFEDWDEKKESI